MERPDSGKEDHPSVLNGNTSREADFAKFPEERGSQPGVSAENEQDRKCLVTRGKTDAEIQTQENASTQREPNRREILGRSHENDLGNSQQPRNVVSAVMTPGDQSKLEDSGASGNGFANDVTKVPLPTNFSMNELVLHRIDYHKSQPKSCGLQYFGEVIF